MSFFSYMLVPCEACQGIDWRYLSRCPYCHNRRLVLSKINKVYINNRQLMRAIANFQTNPSNLSDADKCFLGIKKSD
jgi:hypothetical protein